MEDQRQIFENDYTVVNIWTSEENNAISGANVGHVSIQTRYNYISFWPGARGQRSQKNSTFFQKVDDTRSRYFGIRSPSFKQDYEMDCFLEACSERQIRDINHIKQCQPSELPYLLNTEDMSFRILDAQPKAIDENEKLIAVQPCYANVRLVLYGLSIDKISACFSEMQKNIPGWRLVGSNVFSRLADGSAENCSSLAYRLLREGGMYAELNSGLSSQTSSVVKPDDLLRHIVAAKEKELEKYPETQVWIYPGESTLKVIKQAYSDVGRSANAEDDTLGVEKKTSPDRGCIIS